MINFLDLPVLVLYDIFWLLKDFSMALILTNKQFYSMIVHSDLYVYHLKTLYNFWDNLLIVYHHENYAMWIISTFPNFHPKYKTKKDCILFDEKTSLKFFEFVHSQDVDSNKLLDIVQKIIICERLDLLIFMVKKYDTVVLSRLKYECIRLNKYKFYGAFDSSFLSPTEKDLMSVLDSSFLSDFIYKKSIRENLYEFFRFMLKNYYDLIKHDIHLLKSASDFKIDADLIIDLVSKNRINIHHFSEWSNDQSTIQYFVKNKLYDIPMIANYLTIYKSVDILSIVCDSKDFKYYSLHFWHNSISCRDVDKNVYQFLWDVTPKGFYQLTKFRVRNREFLEFCAETFDPKTGQLLIRSIKSVDYQYDHTIIKMIVKYRLFTPTISDFVYSLDGAIKQTDFEFISMLIDDTFAPFYTISDMLIDGTNRYNYKIKYDVWHWLFNNYEINCTDEETNLETMIINAIRKNDVETLTIFYKLGVKFSPSLYYCTLFVKKRMVFELFYNNFELALPKDIDKNQIRTKFGILIK